MRTLIITSVLRTELVKESPTADNWWRAQRELITENQTTTEKEAEGGVSTHGERQEVATNVGAADDVSWLLEVTSTNEIVRQACC